MATFEVVRIRETNILNEAGNPTDAYRVYFELEGYDEIYHVDVLKSDAEKEAIEDAVAERASLLTGLLSVEG